MPDLTPEQLSAYNGSTPGPIYLAIKGTIFDVTSSSSMYSVSETGGKGYSIFSGKDASRGLAKSSLEAADAVGDTSGLKEDEVVTLEKWYEFFKNKYPVIGKVVQ